MADPIKPPVAYSYSGFQAINPAKPLPAAQVDNDLTNLKTSIDSTVDAIKDIRRSDGHLANQSVGPDQLSSALTIGFTNRGAWAVDTAYSGGDGVTYGQAFYSARLGHTSTSGTRPDLDTATWQFLFTFANVLLADGSVTTAKLADGSITTVKLAGGSVTLAKLAADAVVGAQIHAATALTALVDADEVGVWGSAATALRKITWTNVKATFWTALGGLIAAGTAKDAPVAADGLALSDSEASGATKKLLLSDFLTWFSGYFLRFDAAQTLTAPQQQQALTNIGSVFKKAFESAPQTIVNGGSLSVTHTLGVKPQQWEVVMVFIAAYAGYTIGDEILMSSGAQSSTTEAGLAVRVPYLSTTVIDLKIGTDGLRFVRWDTNANIGLDPTKAKLIVRAWA